MIGSVRMKYSQGNSSPALIAIKSHGVSLVVPADGGVRVLSLAFGQAL